MQPHKRNKFYFHVHFFLLKFFIVIKRRQYNNDDCYVACEIHSEYWYSYKPLLQYSCFFMVHLLYMHSLHLIISSFMLYFGKRKIIGLAEFLDQAMPCDVPVISERCQYQLVFCRDFHTVIVLARLPLIYVIMHKKMVPQHFNAMRLDCL